MISVIICTHNPRGHYIKRTLDAMRTQSLPIGDWELVIVDNASDVPMDTRIDLTWHLHARCVREEKVGLTHARLAGIREAKGELLVFVDDDNVLNSDYFERTEEVSREKPYLGAWSGQSCPEFETGEAPPWTRPYWGLLCIREFDGDLWSNMPRLAATMPHGAGLCVRREVALHYLALHDTGVRAVVLDRAGGSLLSAGDNDLAACACDIGFGVGIIARLKLTHLIPEGRLQLEYLTRLAESIEYSSVVLDHERGITARRPNVIGRVANYLRSLRVQGPDRAILRAVYRGRAKAYTDLSKALC